MNILAARRELSLEYARSFFRLSSHSDRQNNLRVAEHLPADREEAEV
jgi:hypothetical protein